MALEREELAPPFVPNFPAGQLDTSNFFPFEEAPQDDEAMGIKEKAMKLYFERRAAKEEFPGFLRMTSDFQSEIAIKAKQTSGGAGCCLLQ